MCEFFFFFVLNDNFIILHSWLWKHVSYNDTAKLSSREKICKNEKDMEKFRKLKFTK